jgi:hypothetical protein
MELKVDISPTPAANVRVQGNPFNGIERLG